MRPVVAHLLSTAVLCTCTACMGQHLTNIPASSSDSPQLRTSTSAPDSTTMCIVRDGEVRAVRLAAAPTKRDSLINGGTFTAAFPVLAPPYASADWLKAHTQIEFRGRRYFPYGHPVAFLPQDIKRVGVESGITLFMETQWEEGPLLVPLSPGCEFQAYTRLH